MPFVYVKDFDSDSVGTLSGWTSISGSWSVQASKAFSAPNAFGQASAGEGDMVVYTGMLARGDMLVQTTQRANLDASRHGFALGTFVRVTDDAQSGYLFLIDIGGSNGIIYKRVNGTFTNMDASAHGLAATDGQFVNFKVKCQGATLSWKAWISGSPEPTGWTRSITDSSVSAIGKVGLYTSTNSGTGTAGTVTIDNLTVDDLTAIARQGTLKATLRV